MATPVPELPSCPPATREQLPRHIRQLLMTRLRLAQELPDQRSAAEHRRLYLLCQLACWALVPVVVILIAAIGFFTQPTTDVPGADVLGLLSRIAVGQTMGFLLTHAARYPIHRWGWKQLAWGPLLPRLLGAAVVLACLSAGGHFALDAVLGRGPWGKYSDGMVYFYRWLQGMMVFTPWLFIYFIYHQSDRLARSEFERLRLEAAAKEAELRALKSQVNPHFIFNSLNSLRALIEEDPARARGAVTRLAGRYALQSGQHETVPLEDELRIVNDYLALEQVRFEDRLRVRLEAAPDTLSLPVPPLLLQTLVENAVKYGIAPRPEGGEIVIRTQRDGDVLRLEVSNPGSLAPTVPGDDGSTGLGIRNAAERLRLLFGDAASLQVGPSPTAGVLAAAAIPLPHPA
jgi:hypothetical protein